MKKRIFLIALFPFFIMSSFAQVTIGSEELPEKAALLDIKTKVDNTGSVSSDNGGLLLPRVEISDATTLDVFSDITGIDTDEQKLRHKGLTVYNIGTTNMEEGVYVWNGTKWQKAGVKKEINFFYMPSIQIDLSQATPDPINLYEKYRDQFLAPKAASPGAPVPIPYYSAPQDLYYYVTDYDADIIASVNISATGVMTYTLQDPLPGDVCCSYINIIFVVK